MTFARTSLDVPDTEQLFEYGNLPQEQACKRWLEAWTLTMRKAFDERVANFANETESKIKNLADLFVEASEVSNFQLNNVRSLLKIFHLELPI